MLTVIKDENILNTSSSNLIEKIQQIKYNIEISKKPKNIPISTSVLYDLEYNNNLSLYSAYKNTLNKRRSSSERNSTK